MDWERAIREERAAIERLVALLCALAGLSELAVGRSPAVRGFVLWILRHAEVAARDFVGGPSALPPAMSNPAGSTPADAMRLAVSLRLLARQLDRQARLMLVAPGEDGDASEPPPFGRMPAPPRLEDAMSMVTGFAWRGTVPDTS